METFSRTNQAGELRKGEANQKQPTVDILRQQVAEEQKRQKENKELLVATTETFNRSGHKVDELINWSIERPPVRTRSVVNIHHKLFATERLKIDLEDHLEKIYEVRAQIDNESQKISSEVKSVAEKLGRLRSDIGKMNDHDGRQHLMQNIQEQENILQQNDQRKGMLLEQAVSQREKIDVFADMTKRALREAAEDHHKLEQQKPAGHLYFREEDMLPAQAKIEFVPKGRLPGGCVVNITRTLLKAQGVDVTDEKHIAQVLRLHPLGGGIKVTELHTIFPSLGDQKGYQFWKIEPKNLDIALHHGPIAAFFSTDVGNHAVTLDHLEWDTTHKPHVVVLDQLKTEPYKIRVDKFAKAWNGGVLLPRNALRSYLSLTS